MASKKPDSKQPDTIAPALPSWKAFMIQLTYDTTPESGIFAGRVEHLTSGRRERFGSAKELLATVGKMLDQLGEPQRKDAKA